MEAKQMIPRDRMRPVSPGEILQDQLDELHMTAAAFARELHVPTNRITGILNETRALTPDTALRMEQFFGTSAQFWLNLQTSYELRLAELDADRDIGQIRRSSAVVGEGLP
jgi:addiction module HigA family antidote